MGVVVRVGTGVAPGKPKEERTGDIAVPLVVPETAFEEAEDDETAFEDAADDSITES